MKYKTSDPHQAVEAIEYLSRLIEKESIVEVVKVSPRRSLNQNNYLHLLLSAFGNNFGYTDTESKEIYKQLNKETYAYTKQDHTFWKSSRDLTTEEMAKTIDKFMLFSAEQGYELPLATDQEWLMSIENEIERSKYHRNR